MNALSKGSTAQCEGQRSGQAVCSGAETRTNAISTGLKGRVSVVGRGGERTGQVWKGKVDVVFARRAWQRRPQGMGKKTFMMSVTYLANASGCSLAESEVDWEISR